MASSKLSFEKTIAYFENIDEWSPSYTGVSCSILYVGIGLGQTDSSNGNSLSGLGKI